MGIPKKPPATKGLRGAKKGDGEEGFLESHRDYELEPPKDLMGTQQWVWDNVIQPAWWLRERDVMDAFAYTCMTAKLIDEDFGGTATKIEAWRKLAGVLFLTTQSQQRAGIIGKGAPEPEKSKDFFNRAAKA